MGYRYAFQETSRLYLAVHSEADRLPGFGEFQHIPAQNHIRIDFIGEVGGIGIHGFVFLLVARMPYKIPTATTGFEKPLVCGV